MEHTPSIPDLPIEVFPPILHNLDIWSFVKSRSGCNEFKRIVDHHLSIQKSWKLECNSDEARVSMNFPESCHLYIYSKTSTGCEAEYSIDVTINENLVEIKKKFEGKDPNGNGIEHFARNTVVRLNDCLLCVDAEREEMFFKKVFGRMQHKLHTKYLEFYGTPLSIIRLVLSLRWVRRKTRLPRKSPMDQWKLANKLMVDGFGFDGLSSFPIDDKLSLSTNFKDGLIRHFDDLTMDDFIDGTTDKEKSGFERLHFLRNSWDRKIKKHTIYIKRT